MEFFIEAFGIRRVQTRFDRMGVAAIDAAPFFLDEVWPALMRIETATFDSQGRRGGGSWKQTDRDWFERKLRLGLDPRINHATLALRKSFTVPNADHQILDIGPQHIKFGSDLPYARITQENRPVVKLTERDRLMLRLMVRNYLVRAWRSVRV